MIVDDQNGNRCGGLHEITPANSVSRPLNNRP
jgi:hypothetical protein